MSGIVAQQTDRRHVLLPDRAAGMAKAEVRNPDQEYRERIGRAIRRARSMEPVEWSIKEFAAAFKRDEKLIREWESGEKRPPFDELLFHPLLGPNVVVQLARMVEGCEVRTTIEVQERRRV